MERILVIEDSKVVADSIKATLEKKDFSVTLCPDYKTAKETLPKEKFFVAVVDMELPDSNWEKTADLVNEYNVPIIIYSSGEYNSAIRDRVLAKNILDFIQKKDVKSLNVLVVAIERLRRNSHMKVLIADDSKTAVTLCKFILEQAKFNVLTASDGLIALSILEENPDISIVITDYEMPNLNGFELVKKIREKYDSNSLPIIAVSHPSTTASTSKFLKCGANDFIFKPYTNDELYCRVLNHANLVESYKEVNRLNIEKNSLLGMTAHDIRGPLGSIANVCNHLLQNSNYENADRTRRSLKAISETSEKMLQMLNDLLNISSIESGSLDLKPVHSSLSDLIQKRLDLIYLSKAVAKEIEIIYYPESAVELSFDISRMTQVIDNLISNAIKFTPACGVITIDLKKNTDKVYFSISDTGPGLNSEDMNNVFQEFKTLSATPTDGESSTGLGLAICRKIIELHKGEIGVNSTPEGGAEFYFSIPV